MATFNAYGYDATNIIPVIPSSTDILNIPGDATVAGNATVTGNLTVNGTTTTINSEVVTTDPLLHVNGKYHTDSPKNCGIIFTINPENFILDASAKNVDFVQLVSVAATVTITSTGNGNATFNGTNGHLLTLTSTDNTVKKYALVDKANSAAASGGGQIVNGTVLALNDDIGSLTLLSPANDAIIGATAVSFNFSGDFTSFLTALKASIEGTPGHNGKIVVGSIGGAASGQQTLLLTQNVAGFGGNANLVKSNGEFGLVDGAAFSGGLTTPKQIKVTGADDSAQFKANDIIQVSGHSVVANNGLYEVHASAENGGNTEITLKDGVNYGESASLSGLINLSPTADTSDAVSKISVVKIGVIQTDDATNKFQVGFGNNGANNHSGSRTVLALTAIKLEGSTATALAADDLTPGDAAVLLSTTTGNITIDATADNSDIIFKGTDDTADITMLTLQGANAGKAVFNGAITGGGLLTTGGNIVIPNAGNIGSASDTDAIAIANDGAVSFSSQAELPTNKKLQFRDTDIYLNSSTDGQLDIVANDEVQIAATTIDINGAVEVSSSLTVSGATVLSGRVSLTGNQGAGYTFTLGENIAVGEIVYYKNDGSNVGKIFRTDADALATSRPIGIMTQGGTSGQAKHVTTLSGAIIDVSFQAAPSSSDLDFGQAVYLDTNVGKATVTAPTGGGDVVFRLGYAIERGDGSETLRMIQYQPEFVNQVQ